jgi:hypothetical protein
MNNLKVLDKLVAIGPRRGLNEQKAAEIIKKCLSDNNIEFQTQEFETTIPDCKKAELFADDVAIPCVGASFVSGIVDNNSLVLNSFTAESESSMIIFNPVSHGVCLQMYKNTPTVAINRDSVVQLVMANDIRGEVVVEHLTYQTENILVGNSTNPKKIIFAHYDSIVGGGAVDNAGAVEVVMQTILNNSVMLKTYLFVFAGSEEESVSSHDGLYGFEIFNRDYAHLLDNASEILVLDGVGITEPSFISDHMDWVFYVPEDKKTRKILWMQNDQTEVMKYYHSSLDSIDNLKQEYLDQAKELLKKQIND